MKLIKVWCVTNSAIKREEKTWMVCRTRGEAERLVRLEDFLDLEGVVRVESRAAVLLDGEPFVLSGVRLGFAEPKKKRRKR